MVLYSRKINLAGFICCVAFIFISGYLEYGMNLSPCPLCQLQRLVVVVTGFVFLLAYLQHPAKLGVRLYALATLVLATAGGLLAHQQLYLQSLPPSQLPVDACGADLVYLFHVLPFTQAFQYIIQGSGNCAEVQWKLFGYSLPAWTMGGFVILGLLSFKNLFLPRLHKPIIK